MSFVSKERSCYRLLFRDDFNALIIPVHIKIIIVTSSNINNANLIEYQTVCEEQMETFLCPLGDVSTVNTPKSILAY